MKIERIHDGCPIGSYIRYAKHYGLAGRPGVVPASTWQWRLTDGCAESMGTTVHRSQLIKGGKHNRRQWFAKFLRQMRRYLRQEQRRRKFANEVTYEMFMMGMPANGPVGHA